MTMRPQTIGIIGAGVPLLSAGIVLRRRLRNRTKTQQVVKQAHQLSREISQLMTKLEALRLDLRSLDEKARGKRKASA
jgi:outer membrane murein-binding lipoprotein Lpp